MAGNRTRGEVLRWDAQTNRRRRLRIGLGGRCVAVTVAVLLGAAACDVDRRGLGYAADAAPALRPDSAPVQAKADAPGRDTVGRSGDAEMADTWYRSGQADAAPLADVSDVPWGSEISSPKGAGASPMALPDAFAPDVAYAEAPPRADDPPGDGGPPDRGESGEDGAAERQGSVIDGGGAWADVLDAMAADAEVPPTGLPAGCSKPGCNAAPTVHPQLTPAGGTGNVTLHSTKASQGGACLYGNTSIMYYAGIDVNLAPGDGRGQWQGGHICGQCMEVTILTSQGPKPVVVRVMDKCAGTDCGLSLGGSAAEAVMVDGFGQYQGVWRAVACAGHPEVFDGAPGLFVNEGSSAGWAAVQVRNPMTAVAAITWQSVDVPGRSGTLDSAAPNLENYYLLPSEVLLGSGRYQMTVYYTDGSSATVALTAAELATASATYPLS